MSRVTIVVLTVLLASSSVLAAPSIEQIQAQIGAITNDIVIAHGTSGSSVTSLDIHNRQKVLAFHDTSALQTQSGFLMQMGNATADSGIILIGQALLTESAQAQLIGTGHQGLGQVQAANLVGAQLVSKDMATGSASGTALQVGSLGSSQVANNTAAMATQTSQISSAQISNYTGEPGDGGVVVSTVAGSTLQSQTVSVM